jgi:peptide deformylase
VAILPVRVLPDPILRREARAVDVIDDAIRKLAADMIESMQAGYGVGLAAPQVGVLRRVVTLQMPGEEPFVLINPVISDREGERRIPEGCLSLPGWTGIVTRAVSLTADYLDLEGEGNTIESATDLLAQAIEHEVDHLNGIVFTDHLQAHIDLWKAGEEPDPQHDHPDIDFEREAANDDVVADEDRQQDEEEIAESDEEFEEEEEPEPIVHTDLAIYQQADLDHLDMEVRRLRSQLPEMEPS